MSCYQTFMSLDVLKIILLLAKCLELVYGFHFSEAKEEDIEAEFKTL